MLDEEKFMPILTEIKEICGKIISTKEIIEKLDILIVLVKLLFHLFMIVVKIFMKMV